MPSCISARLRDIRVRVTWAAGPCIDTVLSATAGGRSAGRLRGTEVPL
jgi:hypothetical protein